MKKCEVRCVCTLPLTTAHSKVGTLAFASKAPDIYAAEEVRFFPWWLSRSLWHSTMPCILKQRKLKAAIAEEE